ncbi:GNAT family N-acetyltransferase [Ectobacillus sp. JY-23]|uniref:GNAT family N-acetyltransferase n=1 Tax=Ectobacillus sp. JY-23 TaxID=2933872 RepID=UPI001FF21D95|nr:GNAT family N-acetyltransferase [Ectobacillus sp. JY-23]UOY91730.1 GNAT family N-acetyltransferase [Ectobacillus sp. JY-23]
MSSWYARLTEYFPEKEMKSKKHFETLFHEKKGIYQLEEGQDYLLIYFEQPDYIFIDYILVSGSSRGKGTGSMILNQLKQKGKAIILEIEPVTCNDADSEKRVRFYKKNGFLKMNSIQYERIHMVTHELNTMDIFAWLPVQRTELWVYEQMQDIYSQVHAFKARELYGSTAQPVSDVLCLRELTTSNLG